MLYVYLGPGIAIFILITWYFNKWYRKWMAEQYRLLLISNIQTLVVRRLGIDELALTGLCNDKFRHRYGLSSMEHWEEMTTEEAIKILEAYGK